jgi:hypothetical protein
VTVARPPKIITRSRAWGCVAVNQLAFPGLGTIMAGRKVGYIQATIMVVGFCLFMAFMLVFFIGFARFMSLEFPQEQFHTQWSHRLWLLWSGLGLTAVAWLWALASSLSILRAVSPNQS